MHPDGRVFSLNSTWSGAGKLHISGYYPKDGDAYRAPRDWGVVAYNEEAPSVNVSATREPVAIARDIVRRFLPAYTEIYRACIAKQQQQNAYRTNVNNTAAQLAALIPGAELRERDSVKSVHFYSTGHGYGDFSPSSDTVNMDLRSLPVALARRIAALIGKSYRTSLKSEASV